MEESADAKDLGKFSQPMSLPSGVSMLPLPSQQIEPNNKEQPEAVPKGAKVEKRKIEQGQPCPFNFNGALLESWYRSVRVQVLS